jgi:hypothetical protein
VNVNNPQRIKGGNTYTHFHPVQCRLRHDEVVFKPGRAEHPHQASSRLSKRDYISGQRRWIVELHQQCRGEERRINGAGIKCVETCEQSGLDSQNVQDSIKADVNDAKVETFPQSYQASTSASTTTVFGPSPRLKILNLSLQDRFAYFRASRRLSTRWPNVPRTLSTWSRRLSARWRRWAVLGGRGGSWASL